MTDATLQSQELLADEGVPLKQRLQRATRRQKMQALMLVAPLFLFIFFTFVWPIGDMLFRSVYEPDFGQIFHRTAQAIQQWDGEDLPDEPVFRALYEDFAEAAAAREETKAGTRLNFEDPGSLSLFKKTRRRLKNIDPDQPIKPQFLEMDRKWQDRERWAAIKRVSGDYTSRFYLNAVDLKYNADGEIVEQPEYRQIYTILWNRTFWISALVTFFCFVLGFPVAYLLANLPLRYSNLLMILVLLPFWTSLLVRTSAWIALLQTEGVINDLFVWVGIIGDDGRIQMIYNQTGTIIAMTHILLPFMILPLYSVMKTIPPSYMRAARSLGADAFTAFRRVYFPQTLPGIGAGSLLVFILSIGYYITPALVGGQTGQLISNFIAFHMQSSLNWGLAAALGALLLAAVLLLYYVYNKLIGVEKMSFG